MHDSRKVLLRQKSLLSMGMRLGNLLFEPRQSEFRNSLTEIFRHRRQAIFEIVFVPKSSKGWFALEL